nr:hypothetical protein [Nitrospirota bacterium]
MLETIDLTHSMAKDVYKRKAPPLREKLRLLQYQCKAAEIPTVIVFEGWDAAGKGRIISRLFERLDPRGFKVHPARPPEAPVPETGEGQIRELAGHQVGLAAPSGLRQVRPRDRRNAGQDRHALCPLGHCRSDGCPLFGNQGV